jgi:flagellar assembly factor FliW
LPVSDLRLAAKERKPKIIFCVSCVAPSENATHFSLRAPLITSLNRDAEVRLASENASDYKW